MSDAALWGLIAGLVVVAVAMLKIILWDRSVPEVGDQIDDPEELTYWTQRAQEARDDFGLTTTRETGGKWAASAAAILGVLTTVAIVAGPSDLAAEVGGTEAQIAAALILVAGSVAAIATLLAGLAEQGSPVARISLTAQILRKATRERAQRSAEQIMWSRILTAVALMLILAAAGVAWLTALTGDEEPSQQSALITSATGTMCGTLVTGENGVISLVRDGAAESIPANSLITLVDECPQ
jgi:hypothetical protein